MKQVLLGTLQPSLLRLSPGGGVGECLCIVLALSVCALSILCIIYFLFYVGEILVAANGSLHLVPWPASVFTYHFLFSSSFFFVGEILIAAHGSLHLVPWPALFASEGETAGGGGLGGVQGERGMGEWRARLTPSLELLVLLSRRSAVGLH